MELPRRPSVVTSDRLSPVLVHETFYSFLTLIFGALFTSRRPTFFLTSCLCFVQVDGRV